MTSQKLLEPWEDGTSFDANHACEEDENAIFFAYDAKWKCSKMVMECKLL
jgi:hypothetical protein